MAPGWCRGESRGEHAVWSLCFPARNLTELIEHARRHPGDVTYSSSGVGNTSHLAPALLARRAGVEMMHVPFQSAAQAQTALIAGQVTMAFNNRCRPFRACAPGNTLPSVTGETRWRDLPEAPTIAEQGFPGFRAGSWIGLLAPAVTPDALLARLERDTSAVVADNEVSERLRAAGFEVCNRGRVEYRRNMEADAAFGGGFIRDAGIRMEWRHYAVASPRTTAASPPRHAHDLYAPGGARS